MIQQEDLRALREREVYKHPTKFGSYSGTAQQIAGRIREEENTFKWMTTRPSEEDPPPISNEEAWELLRLMRVTGDISQDMEEFVLESGGLPEPGEFGKMVSELLSVEGELLANDLQDCLPEVVENADLNKLGHLVSCIRLLEAERTSLQNSNITHSWLPRVVTEILGGGVARWKSRLEESRVHLERISRRLPEIDDVSVQGLDDRDLTEVESHVDILLKRLESKGSLGVLGKLRLKIGSLKQTDYLGGCRITLYNSIGVRYERFS